MSAPVQNNPPTQKRSRIIINLERALHLSPQGQQFYGGAKKKKWPIVLGIIGVLFILLIVGWALSNNRRLFPWQTVIWGMALQFGFALFIQVLFLADS